jgi:hypothetical protein
MTMHEMNALWIPILGIMMPLVLVPTIMILKHRTLRKEWEHKERMQAIEMGLPPGSTHVGGSIAAVGAGVPIAAVIAAVMTTLSYSSPEGEEVAVLGIVWGCTLMIGAIGMITSLFLAHMHTRVRKGTESSHNIARNGKPAFDPDAFDVVSNRG